MLEKTTLYKGADNPSPRFTSFEIRELVAMVPRGCDGNCAFSFNRKSGGPFSLSVVAL
jgi:hypothetical protein